MPQRFPNTQLVEAFQERAPLSGKAGCAWRPPRGALINTLPSRVLSVLSAESHGLRSPHPPTSCSQGPLLSPFFMVSPCPFRLPHPPCPSPTFASSHHDPSSTSVPPLPPFPPALFSHTNQSLVSLPGPAQTGLCPNLASARGSTFLSQDPQMPRAAAFLSLVSRPSQAF